MDDFHQMIYQSLVRIETKLDSKVDNTFCNLKHSKIKDFQTWLSIILSVAAILGLIYGGIKFIEEPIKKDQVAFHG